MSDKEQFQFAIMNFAYKPPVVQRRHDSFAGAGRGNDEVPVTSMQDALGFKFLEHLGLEWLGMNLQPRQRDSEAAPFSPARCDIKCIAQPTAITSRLVLLELDVFSV